MLREHLSQEHGAASRRFAKIDRHVRWIHETVLGSRPSKILDLGCGPGLYSSRLAERGHECTGIDFSPASIEYAIQQASEESLACEYRHADLRTADFGDGFDLVVLIFGEFNSFPPAVAEAIVTKARAALSDDGVLLLETISEQTIRESATQPASWYADKSGLFSAEPHIVLTEHFWHEKQSARTTRWFVFDATSGGVTRYAETMQVYTDGELEALLQRAGFGSVERVPSLTGEADSGQPELTVALARAGS
jgi:SAM-dependent methyltransferase